MRCVPANTVLFFFFFASVPFAFFSPAKLDFDWIMIMNYEDNEILTWQKSDGLFLYGYGASCTGYLHPGGWQYLLQMEY